MATPNSVFALSADAPASATLAATTSTAELTLNPGTLNALVCDQDLHIRIGNTGMAAADNTYFRIPANTPWILEMNRNYSRIRLYNPSASTARYHIVSLFRS